MRRAPTSRSPSWLAHSLLSPGWALLAVHASDSSVGPRPPVSLMAALTTGQQFPCQGPTRGWFLHRRFRLVGNSPSLSRFQHLNPLERSVRNPPSGSPARLLQRVNGLHPAYYQTCYLQAASPKLADPHHGPLHPLLGPRSAPISHARTLPQPLAFLGPVCER